MSDLTEADVERGSAHFLEVARAAGERGDHATAADAHARMAAMLTAANRIDDAVAAMSRAAETARQTGDLDTRAGYLLSLGLLMSRTEGGQQRGVDILHSAATTAKEAGNREREIEARQRIVQVHAGRQDHRAALSAQERVIELLWQGGPSRALAMAYRDSAAFHQMAGRLPRVFAALAKADAVAREAGDVGLAVQVRSQQLALSESDGGADRTEAYDELLAEAEGVGDASVLGSVQLEAAMAATRARNLERGLSLAEAARQSALGANEPERYLMACMVIAEVRETLGDRAGVIGILLTCKATLEQKLGPEAGRGVVQVLDSLAKRWGPEAVSEALEVHRGRMRQTPSS